ncbi:hypothetical protein OIDMADRAFT_59853 [Oidiodendron maius Zn]|uniref:Uncharacterized protein n=1 Tax=Oidiodendron maius (strain Zn) TaxID=913774 RepID=A0A0C3GGV9_OIDMZ|nr:hypothetical protein OIDMADRAFT_59853 [Oidiodendron maius Zn]
MLSEPVQDNKRLEIAIVDETIKNAKEMLLLATLQLDAIAESCTEWEVEEKLKHVPSNLYESYARTLERVDQQPDNFRMLAYRMLL